ncbi:MAG: IS630 family transposase, partial [Treponema sp.]|nr:IS630 family transposase [Treponema sp.]
MHGRMPETVARRDADSLPAEPGQSERFDTTYVRNGTAEIVMVTAPLRGWRRAEISGRRTRADWAGQIKKRVDGDFPDAETIVLVMDNL